MDRLEKNIVFVRFSWINAMNSVFFKFNESLLALNHIDNLFSSNTNTNTFVSSANNINVVLTEVMSKFTIMMLTQLSQLLHIKCLYWRGRYLPYLDPPYINRPFDLCVWGLGGKGGGFVDSEVELSILPKSRSVSAFNLGGPALNRRRDGESNDTTLDLVLIPASS